MISYTDRIFKERELFFINTTQGILDNKQTHDQAALKGEYLQKIILKYVDVPA
jgi:hypothetical protein